MKSKHKQLLRLCTLAIAIVVMIVGCGSGGSNSGSDGSAGEDAGVSSGMGGASGASGAGGSATEAGAGEGRGDSGSGGLGAGGQPSNGEAGNGGDSGSDGTPPQGKPRRYFAYYREGQTSETAPTIYLVDYLTAGYPQTLLPGAVGFQFSPDGHWIEYSTAAEVDLLDLSGATVGPRITISSSMASSGQWAPNSDWLIFHKAPNILQAFQVATGETYSLSEQVDLTSTAEFVLSRWGTRAMFRTLDNDVYFVDLAHVTAASPPAPQLVTNAANATGGWVGDRFYELDRDVVGQLRYAQFDASGFTSVQAVATSLSGTLYRSETCASPPITLRSTNSTDQLWFAFESQQIVEWPATTGSFVSYSPACTAFARVSSANTLGIFDATNPHGAALTTVAFSDVNLGTYNLTWSTDGQLIQTALNGRVQLTWLSPQVTTVTIPGDYVDDMNFYYWYSIAKNRDWISFERVQDGKWYRVFSALRGTTALASQQFPASNGSYVAESTDGSRMAFLSPDGVQVAPADHGILGTPHTAFQLEPNAEIISGQLMWSDPAHLFFVTAVNYADYELQVVDATTDPPIATTIQHSLNGAFALQP